jgi:hypothetical protein
MVRHDYRLEVERVLKTSEVVLKPDYLRWVQNGDLATQARAYQLSATSWRRIQPEPSMEEQCQFMMEHLLACIEANPPTDEYLQSGFEAGCSLAAWLKHLQGIPGTANVIGHVADQLALLYKKLDPAGRNRLETGALEHILEQPALRVYFESWQRDPILR